MATQETPNPNTPENWDQRWRTIHLVHSADTWVNSRLTSVAELVPPNATVLDLAAGPGLIRHKLSHVVSYVPVDFSEEALKLSGVEGILADCTKVPVKDNAYHTVLAMEILEHLDDPRLLITEALRIARFQVITTAPNDRLPPKTFAYHRRTWTLSQLDEFLQSFPQIAFTSLFLAPANIIAQSILV